MMNEFGTPMNEAELSMHPNPGKAMLQEQLATSGMQNNILGAIIGAGVSLFAGSKAASAAKVFFTLYKGDVGILTVELRYGGNFKGYPRFHANMHPDFLKRVGRAKIVLQDVAQ